MKNAGRPDEERAELNARALEQWGCVADEMRSFGGSIGKLGAAVREVTTAMDRIEHAFDALEPLLAELEEEETEPRREEPVRPWSRGSSQGGTSTDGAQR